MPWQTLQPRDARSEIQGEEHRRRARHDRKPGSGILRKRARHTAQDKDHTRRGTRIHQARTALHHTQRRRMPAHEARHRTEQTRHGQNDVYPRRAHHGTPLRRHPHTDERAGAARRQR